MPPSIQNQYFITQYNKHRSRGWANPWSLYMDIQSRALIHGLAINSRPPPSVRWYHHYASILPQSQHNTNQITHNNIHWSQGWASRRILNMDTYFWGLIHGLAYNCEHIYVQISRNLKLKGFDLLYAYGLIQTGNRSSWILLNNPHNK